MDKDKRLVEASWWEGMAMRESWTCSDGQGHAQYIFNSTFSWWVGLCPLPVVCPEVTFFKRTYASNLGILGLLYLVLMTSQQATVNSQLCQRILDTHRQVWLSLLRGHCSSFLGPGAHKLLFVPCKSLFSQSCGNSVIKSHWPWKSNSLGLLSPFARSPGWEICCES